MPTPTKCQAVRQQDEWVCPRCTLRWDVNDPEPPACGRSKWTYDSYRQHENRRRGRQVLRGLIDQLGVTEMFGDPRNGQRQQTAKGLIGRLDHEKQLRTERQMQEIFRLASQVHRCVSPLGCGIPAAIMSMTGPKDVWITSAAIRQSRAEEGQAHVFSVTQVRKEPDVCCFAERIIVEGDSVGAGGKTLEALKRAVKGKKLVWISQSRHAVLQNVPVWREEPDQ